MLIKCPECGKEISDKSKQCIHCGYPLERNRKDDKDKLLDSESYCRKCKKITRDKLVTMHFNNNGVDEQIESVNCVDCNTRKPNASAELILKKRAERQAKLQQTISVNKTNGIACCPKCGSTSIKAVNRGYSLLSGFIGSGKTMNYCMNCGHKWDPKKS